MKKLPNFVKWIIILAALAAMGWMMWAVNDRASRVEMPAPDNTCLLYTSVCRAQRSAKHRAGRKRGFGLPFAA